MQTHPDTADEGPFSWLERWAPEDARAWHDWRRGLSSTVRIGALIPLQATLTGLAALRRDTASEHDESGSDWWPHARAVEVTLDWSLSLTDACRSDNPRPHGPDAALLELRRSLLQTLTPIRSASRLRPLGRDELAASLESFLDELETNRFFRPPAPLEFCNLEDLVGPELLGADLHGWNDTRSTAAVVAFLSLLRSHRYLGVADREIAHEDGVYRAHVVLTGVRRELLALADLLGTQGADAFPDEPEAAESLAALLAVSVRATRREHVPESMVRGSLALPAERLRNVIRELRDRVKHSAKRIRNLAAPAERRPVPRASERVPRDLSADVWSFRLIARAFLDKAEAAATGPDAWTDRERFVFASEFARHFRKFGPRLAKGTDYDRRGPLVAAVSLLSNRDGIDAERLGVAAHECERFVQHLDGVLDETRRLGGIEFDKRAAAAELLAYLAESSRRSSAPPAAGVFGETRPRW